MSEQAHIVKAHRASSSRGDQPVGSLRLEISEELPPSNSIDEARFLVSIYEADAERIARALFDHLPGGTFDRLLAVLLARKASTLRIPFGRNTELA